MPVLREEFESWDADFVLKNGRFSPSNSPLGMFCSRFNGVAWSDPKRPFYERYKAIMRKKEDLVC